MRIKIKSGESSKSFKLKEIVSNQIGRMGTVIDPNLMEPSYTGNDLLTYCLESINKFYGIDGVQINEKNMIEPTSQQFKESINREWHLLKSKNLFLRSYYMNEKGWLKLKVDTTTPEEVLNKLGIQSRDKLMMRVEKHNKRIIDYDRRLVGKSPKGYIEAKPKDEK